MSFTPLSTRFPHFLLDIRAGIKYLKYMEGIKTMTNLKAEYETAQTLLWAMKDELEANEFSDGVFSTKSDEFAKQNAKVNRRRSEWERSIKTAHVHTLNRETPWGTKYCSTCAKLGGAQ